MALWTTFTATFAPYNYAPLVCLPLEEAPFLSTIGDKCRSVPELLYQIQLMDKSGSA